MVKRDSPLSSVPEDDASILAGILSAAKDAIIIIDDDGLVRLWSKAAGEIFGYSSEEVLGKELHPFIALPENLDAYREKFRRFRDTGKGDAVGKTLELVGRRRSGDTITVELSLNSLRLGGRWHAVGVVRDVTDKKEMERRLAESEEFFHGIYNNTDTAFFVVDITEAGDYILAGLNPVHERLTGLRESATKGKRLEEFLDAGVAAAVRANYDLCVQSGGPIEYEEKLPFRGEDTWWLTSLIPLKEASGRIHRILGASILITERKKIEQRMREAYEFTERIIGNAPLGIATFRGSGECVSVNDAYLAIIGAPDRETALAMNFHRLSPWKESGQYERALEALRTGELRSAVTHMTTIFGREVWLNTRLVPFLVKDEQHLLLMLDDITPLKRSELAAREGMMFVHSLLETMPNPVFYKDTELRYIGCNRAFEEFLGLSRMKIIGRSVFDIAPPEMAAIYDSKDRELLANPPRQVYETKVKGAGGIVRDFMFHKAVFAAEGDIPAGIIGVMLDVTERKKTEEMFRELSLSDALTGLGNRRNFNDMLAAEWKRAGRNGESLGLLLIDIDYFKLYNDTYGHQAGDECLAAVAAAIKRSAGRGGDFAARYGGEEFTVLLPATSSEGTAVVGERIRRAVMDLHIPHAASTETGCVTVSVGVAALVPAPSAESADLVTMADAALYGAKEKGRNRVES